LYSLFYNNSNVKFIFCRVIKAFFDRREAIAALALSAGQARLVTGRNTMAMDSTGLDAHRWRVAIKRPGDSPDALIIAEQGKKKSTVYPLGFILIKIGRMQSKYYGPILVFHQATSYIVPVHISGLT
jgi:hypothetical protein